MISLPQLAQLSSAIFKIHAIGIRRCLWDLSERDQGLLGIGNADLKNTQRTMEGYLTALSPG
jgi:hypothetical protein